MADLKTIHLLSGGLPLCAFTRDYPRDWPAGHTWMAFSAREPVAGESDLEHAVAACDRNPGKQHVCGGCEAKAKEIIEVRRKAEK